MLQKCSILIVARVFFNEPTKEHYLIEISKKTSLAHTSVKKYLLDLKKNAIITEFLEKKGKRYFPIYKADFNSLKYKVYKQMDNLVNLESSGLIGAIKDKCMPKSIIVFGSYAKGEDIEGSDVDIFVECKEEKLDLELFEKQLQRKIHLHFKENLKEYPKELRNNIINGIVLRGYLEAV